MTELNVPLLRKAVEWAEAEAARGPLSEWDQGEWEIAGRVYPRQLAHNIISYYEPDIWISGDSEYSRKIDVIEYYLGNECGSSHCVAGYIVVAAGSDEQLDLARLDSNWSAIACGLLGISEAGSYSNQHGWLFGGGNTIERVRQIAEDIAGEPL